MKSKKKINILFLLNSNNFSGAENVVCNIINNLKKQYNVYYCSKEGPIRNILLEKEINYIPIKFNWFNLNKIIKEYNIDIIHANDLKASFLASFFNNKVKVISHLHGGYPFFKTWNIYTIIYNIIQKNFDKIFVVSDDILNDSIFYNNIKDKTIVLENILNKNDILNYARNDVDDYYDILYVGRIIDLKQPLLFLEIVSKLIEKDSKLKVAMLGVGDLENVCQKYIDDYQLNNNIKMLGFVSNPYAYMKKAKLLIMPSKFEGLPMTAIESLILGVPVVNSGVNGLGKLFKNTDLICHNIDQYIKVSQNILYYKKKYNTKELVEKYTDIDAYIKKITNVYEEIINEK